MDSVMAAAARGALPEEMRKTGAKNAVYVMDIFDPECFYFVLDEKAGFASLAVQWRNL